MRITYQGARECLRRANEKKKRERKKRKRKKKRTAKKIILARIFAKRGEDDTSLSHPESPSSSEKRGSRIMMGSHPFPNTYNKRTKKGLFVFDKNDGRM
jgi:hypothetical protein